MKIVKGFDHFEIFKGWWKERCITDISLSDIPVDHFYCSIENEKPIGFFSLITTNCSNCSYIENLIVDPLVSKERRSEVIHYMQGFVECLAKTLGYNKVMSLVREPKLAQKYADYGFIFTDHKWQLSGKAI